MTKRTQTAAAAAWLAGALVLTALGAGCGGSPVRGLERGPDPLPSWRDGGPKDEILDWLDAVTRPGSRGFVSPADRIAVFDNDGTLIAEKPIFFQGIFVAERARDTLPDRERWPDADRLGRLLDGGLRSLIRLGTSSIMDVVGAAFAGSSQEAYEEQVRRFLAEARHERFGVPYTDLVYRPMLELVALLQSHGFDVFIVSGGGSDFVRVYSEGRYGIPRQNVIGSPVQYEYVESGGKASLLRKPVATGLNDRAEKPASIQRHVGRRPVFAAGNSDGDLEMLTWAGRTDGGPALRVLLRHDDQAREFAYEEDAREALDRADDRDWTVVSMRDDWERVFDLDAAEPAD
jgi:hypothetical protein